jgi:hypothetical protein
MTIRVSILAFVWVPIALACGSESAREQGRPGVSLSPAGAAHPSLARVKGAPAVTCPGSMCTTDADCPGSTCDTGCCLLPACTADPCSSDADCPGSTCNLPMNCCFAQDPTKGAKCANDGDCAKTKPLMPVNDCQGGPADCKPVQNNMPSCRCQTGQCKYRSANKCIFFQEICIQEPLQPYDIVVCQ